MVAVTGRTDNESAREKISELSSLGAVLPIFIDVKGRENAEKTVASVLQEYGRLDVLVHSAGGPAGGRILDISEDDWKDAFDIHIHSIYHLFRASYQSLAKEGGAVLLVSSVAGFRGCPNSVAYQTVKGALPQLCRALAVDHAKEGIRINAIAPGIIRTDFHAGMSEEARMHNINDRILVGREGTPEDVASMSLELIRNGFITGETVAIDGGMGVRIVA
jgi:NAD(P)-dependent dehydrogenase (short-subunit alcohol dehydrogenase family)